MIALALLCARARADTASPAQMPLSYVAASAAYPWTGRLRAIAFRPQPADRAVAPGNDAWEAGALLLRRDPSTRSLFTSLAAGEATPERLVPLSWPALDDASRAQLDAAPRSQQTDGKGAARLGWLRGRLEVDGSASLRPRDTPLANAAGARVLVVPPPLWQPGQPGHAAFRERYRLRPTTVWLGTSDTLLHGFDAVSGAELTAYLPRTMLRQAGWAAMRNGTMVHAPCPRPETVDANLAGIWSTLLLCGVGEPGDGSSKAGKEDDNDVAGVFVLDISNIAGPLPIRLVWELAAAENLPLSPAGPVRAAMLDDGGLQRWYAVVPMMGPDAAGGLKAAGPSLALLPLDKPAAAHWRGHYAIGRLALPAGGCDDATPAPLVALSISTGAYGMALAAYAADARGRLWRVALEGALAPGQRPASVCLHHLSARTRAGLAEAPALIAIPGGTLAIYGAGTQIAAIADTGTIHGTPPRRIVAVAAGDGFVLRGDRVDQDAGSNAGWTVQLPRAGETLDRILPAAPGYLGFVTRTPDNNLHAYLVHAVSGESRTRENAGGVASYMATGHTAGPAGSASIEVVRLPLPPTTAPTPGATTRGSQDVSLWALDGANARQLARVAASRRTGRIGWRELVQPEAP